MPGYEFGFDSFGIMFTTMFVFMMGIVIVTIILRIKESADNSASPVLTVDATMVTKRSSYHRRVSSNDMRTSTNGYEKCFATFEFESGDRVELSIVQREYGLLRDGDFGKLTFQGKKFISFERIKN